MPLDVTDADSSPSQDEAHAPMPPRETDASADASTSSPLAGGQAWLPWTLVVVLAGLCAWVWLGLYGPVQQEQARENAARDTMVNFLSQLTNWDASAGLAGTQDELLEFGTEGFRSEVGSVFQGMDDLVAREVTSAGVIEDLFVQRVEEDTAVLFGVVEQTFNSNQPGDASVVRRSFRATLVDENGDWRIQRLELVLEEQLSGATPGLPNIGSEPSPAADGESDASAPPADNTGDSNQPEGGTS